MSPDSFHHRSLPLPRGWPRRVRSAVVQVISLARTSLTLTYGWTSESLNPVVVHRFSRFDSQLEDLHIKRPSYLPPLQPRALWKERSTG
jgi:hypothetical protein